MAASPVQLLLPPLPHWPRPLPERIARALGRANSVTPGAGGLIREVPASAALSRLGEGDLDIDAVRAHRWLRAEPAWIRPDINGARLYAVGAMLPLDRDDVAAFTPELQALFDDAGYRLETATPHRWYLRLPRDALVPRFATPALALGADPFDHLPEGEGARAWRVLDNEVQITLHQHPRNLLRQQRGLPPVNALWCWGEADLPDPTQAAIPTLHSDDPLLRGLARASNIDSLPLPPRWPSRATGLYDLRGVPREALYPDWLQPALDDIEQGSAMHWTCEEGPDWLLKPAQRWRFWRPPLRFPADRADAPE